MHFQCKTIFSFQHIAGRFCCFLYICFLGCFSQFCHHKTTNSFIFAKYMYSVLFCLHQIMWRNKRNFGHSLEIISCCFFFLFRGTEETKFEINTTSIILSCLYHFMTANKELCIYCCKMPHYKINKILF